MAQAGRSLGLGWRSLSVLAVAFLCFAGFAPRAQAGGVFIIIPATLTSDELYDNEGNTFKPTPDFDVSAPNLGLVFGYNWPVRGVAPEDWNPVVGVNLLFWLVDVNVTAAGQELTSGFKPAFFWPIAYFDSKYLNLSVGFEFDLSPDPDPTRRQIPNTDLSDALTFGGTVKYPIGDFALSAGVDYLLTFEHEEPGGVKVNPSDWIIVRGTATYSFPISETVKGSVGAMLAFYHYTAPETNGIRGETGNHFLIQPQFGLSFQNFFITVIWGTVDEYTSGGISFSGKNSLVKKASGFRAFFGYTF